MMLKMRKIGEASQVKDVFGNYHSNQTRVVGGIALNISLAALSAKLRPEDVPKRLSVEVPIWLSM